MKRVTPGARNIGQRVAFYRVQRGWSQRELAEELQRSDCNFTEDMVWKIEAGYRATSIYEIDKLSQVLGVDYNALFAQE